MTHIVYITTVFSMTDKPRPEGPGSDPKPAPNPGGEEGGGSKLRM